MAASSGFPGTSRGSDSGTSAAVSGDRSEDSGDAPGTVVAGADFGRTDRVESERDFGVSAGFSRGAGANAGLKSSAVDLKDSSFRRPDDDTSSSTTAAPLVTNGGTGLAVRPGASARIRVAVTWLKRPLSSAVVGASDLADTGGRCARTENWLPVSTDRDGIDGRSVSGSRLRVVWIGDVPDSRPRTAGATCRVADEPPTPVVGETAAPSVATALVGFSEDADPDPSTASDGWLGGNEGPTGTNAADTFGRLSVTESSPLD